jgi:hypothetical protein
MKTIYVSIVLLFVAFSSAAQADSRAKAAGDFRAVNAAYINTHQVQMDVTYTLFSGYTSTAAFETDRGVFMKQGNNTYSELLGIVSLSNSNATVTLDSNEQTIVVTDPPDKNHTDPSLVNLDSILKLCSSVEYKELGELNYYRLRFDGVTFFEYNAIEVYIDRKTNFLSRLTLYFRMEVDLDEEGDACSKDKPRLEIVYSNINTAPQFAARQFSETKFIGIKGKTITASPAYSNYHLINNKTR